MHTPLFTGFPTRLVYRIAFNFCAFEKKNTESCSFVYPEAFKNTCNLTETHPARKQNNALQWKRITNASNLHKEMHMENRRYGVNKPLMETEKDEELLRADDG